MVVMPLFINWIQLDPRIGGAWIGGTMIRQVQWLRPVKHLAPLGAKRRYDQNDPKHPDRRSSPSAVAIYWIAMSKLVTPLQIKLASAKFGKGSPSLFLVLSSHLFCVRLFMHRPCSVNCGSIRRQEESPNNCESGYSASRLFAWDWTHIREMIPYFRTGKPMILYLCGQALNLLLTFFDGLLNVRNSIQVVGGR